MAQTVLTNCGVTVNSTSISTSVKSVKVNRTPDMLDNTTFGMGAKSRKKGLDDWSIELQIVDDFASAALDEGLWALFDAGSTFTTILRPNATAVRGPSNPEYSGVGIIESFPIGGGVGELAEKTIRILAAGGVLTRTTTAT